MSSLVAFNNSQGLEAKGTLIRLSRQTVVFEVYNPYSIVQLSEVLESLSIQQGDRVTYRGRAVVTNLVNTGLMLIVSASLVDPWSDLRGLVPGKVLRSHVRDFVTDWETATTRLLPSYQIAVTNLRNYLQEVSRWLEHWEAEADIQSDNSASERMMDFVVDVDQEIEPRLTDLYGQFEQASHDIGKKLVAYHRAFAQRELHPLMMSSPFMNRAFNKPLGYAGDFEMVRMMLSPPWEGGNTFSKLLNASALRHQAPAAHRNRIDILEKVLRRETHRVLAENASGLLVTDRAAITTPDSTQSGSNGVADAISSGTSNPNDGRVKVLNLGCGPAVEVGNFARSDGASANVDFRLIDFNTETLTHVRENLIPELKQVRAEMGLETQQRSVHEIIQLSVEGDSAKQNDANRQNIGRHDVVYCAGLFDYFRDTTCSYLVELFYSWVKPGGLVLVTNVTPNHSSRAIMSLILDWNLELRDESGMKELAPRDDQGNLRGQIKTYVDGTGVNVFLEVRKPLE